MKFIIISYTIIVNTDSWLFYNIHSKDRVMDQESDFNNRIRDEIYAELSHYSEELSKKLSADGSPLIKFPANFNNIVECMNYKDLTSEENNWAHYLLASDFNFLGKKEELRYKDLLQDPPEIQIKRGLAQIQLLDRQLQNISNSERKEIRNISLENEDDTFITKHLIQTDNTSKLKSKPNSSDSSVLSHVKIAEVKAARYVLNIKEEFQLSKILDDNYEVDSYLKDDSELLVSLNELEEKLKIYENDFHVLVEKSSVDDIDDVLGVQVITFCLFMNFIIM